MPQRVVIIVQARMGSTRLPGKVLKPILGKPMLELQLERLQRSKRTDQIVLAIPDSAKEQALLEFAQRLPDIKIFQGSEEDVLARYYGAAKAANADIIVRITSDCPLIEPDLIDRCIESFLAKDFDYVSNVHRRTYPRGLDTEVFSFQALELAFREAHALPDREHVTPFIWRQPDRFSMFDVIAEQDYSHLRWTVDTPEDFELICWIYGQLYPQKPDFSYEDALELVLRYPQWQGHNVHIQQKHYGQ